MAERIVTAILRAYFRAVWRFGRWIHRVFARACPKCKHVHFGEVCGYRSAPAGFETEVASCQCREPQ